MRKLWCVSLGVAGMWIGSVASAHAACTEPAISALDFAVEQRAGPTNVIPALWTVAPSCGVIETGLLLGHAPNTLEPAGDAIHASQGFYQRDLPVSESGVYWIAAYARDEAGTYLQSAPQEVAVMADGAAVAQEPAIANLSLSLQQPGFSYTGTDADFLQPVDEPHYASLRSASRRTRRFTSFTNPTRVSGSDNRMVGSTSREEVLQGHAAPLEIQGEAFNINPALVTAALDELEARWQALGYPRTGFYMVSCRVFRQFSPTPITEGPTCVGVPEDQYFLGTLAWESINSGGNQGSQESTVAYFIPVAPAGKQVQSARVRIRATGSPGIQLSSIPLNGKLPIATEIETCSSFGCRGWLTWDFTEEVRPLAAQGGGVLELTLGPVTAPPGAVLNYTLAPQAHYPWAYGDGGPGIMPDGTVILTFESACPRELTVAVSPATVRPVLPINQAVAAGIRNVATRATVTATAKQCLAPDQTPTAVDVTFTVRPPAGGSDEVGGHLHSPGRPTGTFGTYYFDGGVPTASCQIAPEGIDEAGVGTCEVTYHAHDIAGTETIVATAPEFPEATAQVHVAVENLVPMPTNASRYLLVGAPNSSDPCPNQPESLHEENHWGRTGTRSAVGIIADQMRQKTGILLRVNDMSLPSGGLFDIRNGWTSPHKTHRTGRDTDVGFTGGRDGACVEFDRDLLRAVISSVVGTAPLREGDHFHINGRSCGVCP